MPNASGTGQGGRDVREHRGHQNGVQATVLRKAREICLPSGLQACWGSHVPIPAAAIALHLSLRLSSERTKSAVEPCSVSTTSSTFFASCMKRAAFGDCEPGGWEGQVGVIDDGGGACEVC